MQEALETCKCKWNIPAGHLDPNETIFDGAKREIKEAVAVLLFFFFCDSINVNKKGVEGLMKEKSYKLLLSLGYNNSDANEILSSDWLLNFKDEDLEKNILNVYSYLEKYYTKEEIIKITRKASIIYSYNIKNIEDKINDMISFGYSKAEVIKMTKKAPALYSLKTKKLKQKIEDIIKLGYTKDEVIKMTKKTPSLYCLDIKNINKKINYMISIGYTREDVIKMSKKCSSLYGYSIESMKKKIEDMIKLGYTKEDVIIITKSQPDLYSYNIENIKQKIDDIVKLVGYKRREVIEMTKALPSLFGLNIENIKQKIEFYKSINLENIILEDTKQLMQSATLSYARYRYLTIKGIKITKDNYGKLFYSQKSFKEVYDVDNETLKKLYPFEEYLRAQQLYQKLYILSKLNPNGSKEFSDESVKKYVDANYSIEKRINNKYDKILKK